MSAKKRRVVNVLFLVVALVLVGVIYSAIPNGDGKKDDESQKQQEAEQTVEVKKFEKDSIQSISIEKGKDQIEIVKEGTEFVFKDNKKTKVDSNSVETMLSSLCPISALKELELKGDKKEYGLDNPALIVTIKSSDETYTVKLGAEVPVVGGYYGQAMDDKLYAISDGFFSAFNKERSELIQMETMPAITADYITELSVQKGKKTVFEVKEEKKAKRVNEFSKWNLYKAYEIPVAVNFTTFAGFLESYTTYSFSGCEGYNLKNDKKYGFNQPTATISMKYFSLKDESAPTPEPDANGNSVVDESNRVYSDLKVTIGKKTGDSYFIKLSCMKGVYTVTAESLKELLEPDLYTYIDHTIYAKLLTDIKGVDVAFGKTKMMIKRKAIGKNDEGDTQNTYTLNGKEVDISDEDKESEFLTPYSKVFLLEISGIIDKKVKAESDKPVLTMTYHEDKQDVKVEYLPYDGQNFYRVRKNGEMYFLTDKRGVDDAIEAYQKIK